MSYKLQEGIFYDTKTTPGKFLCIVFLELDDEESVQSIKQELTDIWGIVQHLKNGEIRDLPNVELPDMDLSVTLGYGKNLFGKFKLNKSIPNDLQQYGSFRQPKSGGGGKLLVGSGLNYSNKVFKNMATEDLVLQFTADSELAVNRALVEVWKYFEDSGSKTRIAKFYKGFQREDKRSWIDFHDGISNLKSGKDRLDALQIKPLAGEDSWTEGGTYLAFIKLSVDLKTWRKLSQIEQEKIVGRAKLSGCPLQGFEDGKPIAVSGCPFTGTKTIIDEIDGEQVNKDFFEPPSSVDQIIAKSHVQRANQHRSPTSHRDSLKIFRQGYEFLEPIDENPGFAAGLNFISFQDTPERLQRLLTQPTWLGNINFGGEEENNELPSLLKVLASGIYLIPPFQSDEIFPGEQIFINEVS